MMSILHLCSILGYNSFRMHSVRQQALASKSGYVREQAVIWSLQSGYQT